MRCISSATIVADRGLAGHPSPCPSSPILPGNLPMHTGHMHARFGCSCCFCTPPLHINYISPSWKPPITSGTHVPYALLVLNQAVSLVNALVGFADNPSTFPPSWKPPSVCATHMLYALLLAGDLAVPLVVTHFGITYHPYLHTFSHLRGNLPLHAGHTCLKSSFLL